MDPYASSSGIMPDNAIPIELSISCTNLANMDVLSYSDPMVVVSERTPNGYWKEKGRTEMIKDTLNPKFVKKFRFGYRFSEIQELKFDVYDIDTMNTKNLSEQDFIGQTIIKLSDLCTNKDRTLKRKLTSPQHHTERGEIILEAEEMTEFNFEVTMRFNGRQLERSSMFSNSDPFLVISRAKEGGTWTVVHKTDYCRKTQDPDWPAFMLSAQTLCNGDLKRPILIECWDFNRSGTHTLMGSFTTSIDDLKGKPNGYQFELKNAQRPGRRCGAINLIKFDMQPQSSFLEYIIGGCEINLVVAIDFTGSNGNPMDPRSLHFTGGNRPNEYVQAITAVGEVLSAYDSDLMFPVFGFGAKIPPKGQVSHCFPLTWDPNNPEVHLVSGILQAYQGALQRVTLSGPTIFAEIIKTAAGFAKHCLQADQHYTILLILTDGVINDMSETINEIVRASALPLSIIIVGVGNADFANMDVLDADDEPLKNSSGVQMSRDIVQFVPFRKYRDNAPRLAAELLDEIPAQLLSYMKSRKIRPNPPVGICHDPNAFGPMATNPASMGSAPYPPYPTNSNGSPYSYPSYVSQPAYPSPYPAYPPGPGGPPPQYPPFHDPYGKAAGAPPGGQTAPYPDPYASTSGGPPGQPTRTPSVGGPSVPYPDPYATSGAGGPLGQPGGPSPGGPQGQPPPGPGYPYPPYPYPYPPPGTHTSPYGTNPAPYPPYPAPPYTTNYPPYPYPPHGNSPYPPGVGSYPPYPGTHNNPYGSQSGQPSESGQEK